MNLTHQDNLLCDFVICQALRKDNGPGFFKPLNLNKMKQIFEHYEKWEDFKCGMYSLEKYKNHDELIHHSIMLLSNVNCFYESLIKVKLNWPVSWDVNMSNQYQNRRAWLGAAGCMINHKSPEYITRIAWNQLNKNIQLSANNIANKFIIEYENKNNKLYKNMGGALLF